MEDFSNPPFRLKLLRRICDALHEIDGPLGGYCYNLLPTPEVPERVFRGRVVFGDDDPLPMISILEAVLPPDQFSAGAPDNPNRHGPWDLMIQGFVDDDHKNPTDPAQFLLADVVSRLAKERNKVYRGGGIFGFYNIERLDLGVGVVRPPDEISSKAYFWLPVTIVLVEDLTNPYFEGETEG